MLYGTSLRAFVQQILPLYFHSDLYRQVLSSHVLALTVCMLPLQEIVLFLCDFLEFFQGVEADPNPRVYVKNGQQLADSMRALRRSSKIDPHVGISFHKPEKEGATSRFYVNCNAGRIMRPLIIIKDGHSLLTSDILDKISKKLLGWRDLLRMGIIELTDANEEENPCDGVFGNIQLR